MARKILNAIWNLAKGIIIIVVIIFSLLYVMDQNEPGSSALITKDCKVYEDPAAGIESDRTLSACNVVEKIGDPNSYGYTKIRFYESEIGYVPSYLVLDTSALLPSEISDATRVAKVNLDRMGMSDSDEDTTCKILRDLVRNQEETPISGVYVSVNKERKGVSLLTSTLENLHIPYGYFVKCDDFSSTQELIDLVSEELVDTETKYNILPLTFGLTGSRFSESVIKNKFSEDIAFSGVRYGNNYWSIMHEESADDEFTSSNNFAIEIEYENDDAEEYISLVHLNNESLLFSGILEKYNTITE